MSGIPLAFGSYLRRTGRFPSFVAENLFSEPSPASQDRTLSLIGRAGMELLATIPDTPLRGIFYQKGLFDEDALVVAGTKLYRVKQNGAATAVTGTITGTNRVVIAGGLNSDAESEARIAAGDKMYVFNGVTVVSEDFAESNQATDVAYAAGQWIGVPTSTQELYVRYISDTTWDALTFASAEYQPDKIVKVVPVVGQVIAFGESSAELFALTGDPTNPIEPLSLKWPIGCMARDAVAQVGQAVCMVAADGQVYRFGPTPAVISDPGLTEQLRQADPNSLVGWSYRIDGHEFYVLNCDRGSFVWDGSVWNAASSYGYDYWRAGQGAQVGTRILALDALPGSGGVYRLDPDLLTDDGDPIVHVATAWLEIKEGQIAIDNVVVNCAVGEGPRSGQGSAPVMQIRCSRDGKTFSGWREAPMPLTGQHSGKVRINRWGTFQSPGALFQFRVSDPAPFRVTDIRANVA